MRIKSVMKGDRDSSMLRNVFRYNYTTLLFGTVVALTGMIVDGIIIGQYLGEEAIAAYGVIMSVFLFLNAFSGLLSAGGEALIGQAMGFGHVEEANQVLSIVNKCLFILSAALVAMTLLLRREIVTALGMPPEMGNMHNMCMDYFLGLIIGFPVILWATTIPTFLSLDSDAMRAFIAILVSTAVNIAGDLLNVHVFHGGMFGMALATSVSYLVMCVVVAPHFLSSKYSLKFRMQQSGMKGLKELIKAGMPTGMTRAVMALRTIGLNRILLAIGSAGAVSAMTVGTSVSDFYSPVMTTLGMVVLMMSSAFLKEEDRSTMSQIFKTMVRYCFGPILLVTLAVVLLAGTLVTLYLPEDSSVFPSALACTIYMAICLPLNSLHLGIANYLQGIGKYRPATVFSILESGGALLLCALILGNLLGVQGVWIAFPVSEAIMMILYVIYATKFQKHFPRSIRDFLFLDDSFGVSESDQMEFTMYTMDQVMACSEAVRQFSLDKNISMRNANLISLSVEELGGNIIQWGFQDGKKHSINLRLIYKDGSLSLRIRDDCIPFDPKKQAEMYLEETGAKNYGLRMIAKMVQEMRYVNLMRLNILFIKI